MSHLKYNHCLKWNPESCGDCEQRAAWVIFSGTAMIYLCTIQDADHINISIRTVICAERFLNAFGYVVFRQSDESGLAEPVGEYNDANRVSFLDWCVIWVQVLQESLEGFACCVRDGDLKMHANWMRNCWCKRWKILTQTTYYCCYHFSSPFKRNLEYLLPHGTTDPL